MQETSPVGSATFKAAPNKYLVKLQTNAEYGNVKHCTALSTFAFDNLDLKHVTVSTSVFDELVLSNKTIAGKTPETHLWLSTVPKGSCLYQGAMYDFDKSKPLPEMADDYYKNYYDKRNGGAYFVGPKNVADIYGKKQDGVRVVYANMYDFDNEKETSAQEYLYPLCYIPGIRGSRVKYTTTDELNLLDVSQLTNVRFLWSITETLKDSDKKFEQYVLTETLVQSKSGGIPTAVHRKLSDTFDPDLVQFFQTRVAPYVKQEYGIELHGYIYHQLPGNTFHDEICLLDRSHLHFDSVEISPKTKYNNLPTMEEWKKQHDAEKVPNNRQSLHHTTLFPGVNQPLIGPRRKEDGDRTTSVFDDHSGRKPGWKKMLLSLFR